jgi:hypothetical protein
MRRDPKHRVGTLAVPLQPRYNRFRRICRHEDIETSLGDPLADEGSQGVRLLTTMWAAALTAGSRSSDRLTPVDAETKPPENLKRLMSVEVRAIKPGSRTDHLFRWKPPTVNDDVIAAQGVWQLISKIELDI